MMKKSLASTCLFLDVPGAVISIVAYSNCLCSFLEQQQQPYTWAIYIYFPSNSKDLSFEKLKYFSN